MKKKKSKTIPLGKVNFNSVAQRRKLYERTFLTHNTESLLFTLQKEAINLGLESVANAVNPSTENLLRLAESVAGVEMSLEFTKMAIAGLEDSANNIRNHNLMNVKKNADKAQSNGQTNESESKTTESTNHDLKIPVIQKKGLISFARHIKKYFDK